LKLAKLKIKAQIRYNYYFLSAFKVTDLQRKNIPAIGSDSTSAC